MTDPTPVFVKQDHRACVVMVTGGAGAPTAAQLADFERRVRTAAEDAGLRVTAFGVPGSGAGLGGATPAP